MFLEQIEINRRKAFEHFVECWKKQDKSTVNVNGNKYSYKTKRGILKEYIAFKSFKEYQKSDYYMGYEMVKVEGFIFVEI